MTFRQYIHVEKFGNTAVEGIDVGRTYVFPKLDGTNASVWHGEGKAIECGSRTRHLHVAARDNAGFREYIWEQADHIQQFLHKYPHLRLYGEWLVPHTLGTYLPEAWRKFYVFDVYNNETDQYLTYEVYKELLDDFNIDYIPPLAIFTNATPDFYIKELERNNFLIKNGEGIGEGVVIKNYDFYNKFGKQVWAKIISSEFKGEFHKVMGAPEIGGMPVEMKIADEFITKHLVDKTIAKIKTDTGEWTAKQIPRLLETVFYDLVNEELWSALKKHKQPTINFKALKNFSIKRTKELAEGVF